MYYLSSLGLAKISYDQNLYQLKDGAQSGLQFPHSESSFTNVYHRSMCLSGHGLSTNTAILGNVFSMVRSSYFSVMYTNWHLLMRISYLTGLSEMKPDSCDIPSQ